MPTRSFDVVILGGGNAGIGCHRGDTGGGSQGCFA